MVWSLSWSTIGSVTVLKWPGSAECWVAHRIEAWVGPIPAWDRSCPSRCSPCTQGCIWLDQILEFWWFGAVFRTKMAIFRPDILTLFNWRDASEASKPNQSHTRLLSPCVCWNQLAVKRWKGLDFNLDKKWFRFYIFISLKICNCGAKQEIVEIMYIVWRNITNQSCGLLYITQKKK